MTMTLQKTSEAALSLSQSERAALAHALIQSLDSTAEEGHEQAWDTEIQSRIDKIESGQSSERDAFEALDDLRARFQ